VRHISYDPRISKTSMAAFNAAQDELIRLGSSQADKRLQLPTVVLGDVMRRIEQTSPKYFADLKQVGY
jgi:hypothetical protein